MFVFYFGILADLTPPTAISTYATSAIAGADVWRTQWVAMMLALSGFVIPFSFVYDPALLLMNSSIRRTSCCARRRRTLRHRDARHRRDRLSPRADPAVGAARACWRGAVLLIFPGTLSDRRRRGVLRGGVGRAAGEGRAAGRVRELSVQGRTTHLLWSGPRYRPHHSHPAAS